MVRRTEIYIPIKKLTKLSLSCPHCSARVVIDISSDQQRKELTSEANDKWCIACGTRFASTAYLALDSLIKWYDAAIKLQEDIHFILDDEKVE